MNDAAQAAPRTGGEILADGLIAQGVDTIFGVPGESFLAVLDAVHARRDRLRFVTCRQEGGAAFAAEAHGKLTGRPGVVLVTRGPGACNASIGVHTAFQDSTPMVVLIGQVPRRHREREAFQEVEYRHMFAPMAKWVCEVDTAARLPEHLGHAFSLAQSGRPGPVVLALPEDVLTETATATDLPAARIARAAPDPAALARLPELLAASARPVAVVGGAGWTETAAAELTAFAEAHRIPVLTSLRRQDLVDNGHPCYAGDLGISANREVVELLKASDLILAIGARLGEMTTQGYTVPAPPRPPQTMVHVFPDAAELGRVYHPELPVVADPGLMAQALAAMAPPENIPEGRAAWYAEARATYERLLPPPPQPGALDMGQVITALRARLPRDAILTNGAGNYTAWVHKFWQFRGFRTQLAPTSGAMGYGLPAALAAGLAHPGRRVVAFAGDGCFLMNGQEMATIRHLGLAPLIVVFNNGMLGTIRMHQEREFPGRVEATGLTNPDFAAMAAAFGFHAERLERSADIDATLDRALAHPGPALVECVVDPEGVTPRTTLTALHSRARA